MAEGWEPIPYETGYVVDEFFDYATKNFTIPQAGLYLVLARGNAVDSSTQPTIRIIYNNNESKNTGAVGGAVTTYKLITVGNGDTISIFAEGVGTNSYYLPYNRVTIIRLH